MPKFFSVLFLVLFSISAFAQSSLIELGSADVSGTSTVHSPLAPVTFLDQAPNQSNGYFADTCRAGGSGNTPIADNFVVTVAGPAVGITEIILWGGYYPQNIPNTTDDFTMIIHSDAGGLPGAAIYSMFNLEPTTRALTGVVLFGVDEYIFTFDFSAAPLIITTAGTYWIEIYNCSTLSDAFFWETGDLDVTNGVFDHAFAVETPGVNWNFIGGTESSIQINGDDNIPVELSSFTASASEGLVELSWITATETNNQGFEVQRSAGSEFESIAFVEGHGTTTESQAYSYSDKDVNAGSYSYRLKQVDFDGTFEYSIVVEVEVSGPAVFALDQNYPNPFNPNTKISFRLAVDSKVSLKVFDVLGQEVATLLNGNIVAGSHQVDFNASAINSGVYLYQIEATGIDGTNFTSVKKMILTK